MQSRSFVTIFSAVMSLLLLAVGISSAWYVLRLKRMNAQVMDFNVSSIRAAEEMEILVREVRYQLDRFLVTGDAAHLTEALRNQSKVESWLAQAQRLTSTRHEKDLVDEIARELDDLFVQLRPLVENPHDAHTQVAVDKLVVEVLSQRVLRPIQRYLDLNEQELQRGNQQNQAMAERLAMAFLLLGTSGAIAGLVAGYGVARSIRRSILQLTVPIRDVAGKLNEVVGPIAISADPSVEELEDLLATVSNQVTSIVEQLQLRQREVLRADQLAALGQLAAGLAHELRNPLMCMKVLVQSAARQGESATLDARDLHVLHEEFDRLESLLQAFTDFARPAVPNRQDTDVASLIRQTVELISLKAQRRHVQIDCRLQAETMIVDADAGQIRQVLLNLLLNALDAVPNGGRIWVEAFYQWPEVALCSAAETASAHVCVRVSDNGRGLPREDRQRIYEPFFSTKETGLGLGLAICHRIIQAHGGQILARDREGGGAIFEATLACKDTPQTPECPDQEPDYAETAHR